MLRLACSCGTHSRSRLSLAAKYVSKPLELKVLSGIDSNSKGNICGACGYSLFFQFAPRLYCSLACLLVSSTTKLSSLLFVRYQIMDRKKICFISSICRLMSMESVFLGKFLIGIYVLHFILDFALSLGWPVEVVVIGDLNHCNPLLIWFKDTSIRIFLQGLG
jgi:hypothetical protein